VARLLLSQLLSIKQAASNRLAGMPQRRVSRRRWAARESQVFKRIGIGDRGNPYRYWLPGHEPLLWPADGASHEEQEAWRKLRHEFANGRYTPPAVGLDV
jgi:hypothetical protein